MLAPNNQGVMMSTTAPKSDLTDKDCEICKKLDASWPWGLGGPSKSCLVSPSWTLGKLLELRTSVIFPKGKWKIPCLADVLNGSKSPFRKHATTLPDPSEAGRFPCLRLHQLAQQILTWAMRLEMEYDAGAHCSPERIAQSVLGIVFYAGVWRMYDNAPDGYFLDAAAIDIMKTAFPPKQWDRVPKTRESSQKTIETKRGWHQQDKVL